MPRRAPRLLLLLVVLVAVAVTPLQGGWASGGPAPSTAANPLPPATGAPPASGAAAGWQGPRRPWSVPATAAPRTGLGGHGAVAAGRARAALATGYGDLPLAFEPNQGQVDPSVSYLAHGQGYTAFLAPGRFALALDAPISPTADLRPAPGRAPQAPLARRLLRFTFDGANAQATAATAGDPLPGVVNYFLGKDPAGWHTGIPTFGQVAYPGLYPGVDLVYHGQRRDLAFDFTVQPGADAGAIRFHVDGADQLTQDAAGDLVLRVGLARLVLRPPLAYQAAQGAQARPRLVGGRYTLLGGGEVGLALGTYDPARALTIDPVLVYGSYLGGSQDDVAQALAVDSSGQAYLTGLTFSSDFRTQNPFQPGNHGGFQNVDAFVSKVNAAGTALVYSTYLGGSGAGGATGDDEGLAIAADGSGDAYVTGYTDAIDFPTANAYQPNNPTGTSGTSAFVTELNPGGSALVYSTYLGGTIFQEGYGIAVDGSGAAYVTGYTDSPDFPLLNPYQGRLPGNGDGFVTKFNPGGRTLGYSTFLGGSGTDQGTAIAVDGAGAAYVAGYTSSRDFPLLNPLQGKNQGTTNSFVSKFAASGSALVYSTYLGGSGDDEARGIAVDSTGNAYVTGYTTSPDFPLAIPLWASNRGGKDAFVSKLNAGGSALVYSTYLGGSQDDVANGIAVDGSGVASVTGYTYSPDFPTANPLQASNTGGEDAFVARITALGSALAFSTYLGGSYGAAGAGVGVDSAGAVYVDGSTYSTDFPTKDPFQPNNAGGEDAFVAKLGPPSCTPGAAPASSGTVPWHPHYAARITSMMGLSVDLADGHADLATADMQIAGLGPDLVVRHTWDSALAAGCVASSAGLGVQTDLTRSMSGAPGSTIVYEDATGARWSFPYVSGAYQSPMGMPWSLTADGSGYTLSNILTGEALRFDSQGRFTQDTDAYGNYNSLAQSGGGAPTSETNQGSGRSLAMGYANGLLQDIQSPIYQRGGPTAADGQHVAYGYDGQELTSIAWGADSVDPQTGATDQQAAYFGYTGDLLTSVTTPMTMSGALAVQRV